MDPEVASDILNVIKGHFVESVIEHGDKHDLLDVKIELNRVNKNIIIHMIDQIKEVIEIFGDKVDATVTSLANKNLFATYDDKCDQLDDEKSEIFRSMTVKLLFIMKREQPDIETAISYLMTRVLKSNGKDWEKLKLGLGFLQGRINEYMVIGADISLDLHV